MPKKQGFILVGDGNPDCFHCFLADAANLLLIQGDDPIDILNRTRQFMCELLAAYAVYNNLPDDEFRNIASTLSEALDKGMARARDRYRHLK